MNILNSINHTKIQNPLIFTPFTFDICGNTYTGSKNNYPIIFNNSSAVNTFGIITNFSNTSYNNNFTIYIKGKWEGTRSQGVMICFQDTRVVNNFLTISYGNLGKGAYVFMRYLTVPDIYSGGTGNINTNANEFFHIFFNFNISSNNISTYFYSVNGVLILSILNKPYSVNWLPSLNYYTFAKNAPEINYKGYVTIELAGWYNLMLSTTQMSNIAQTLNFIPFQYNIVGGTNYTLLRGGAYPTLYPITLNPQSDINNQTNLNTYCSINNFSNVHLTKKSLTIYVKGNFYYSAAKNWSRLLCFTVSDFYNSNGAASTPYLLQITQGGGERMVGWSYFDGSTTALLDDKLGTSTAGGNATLLQNNNDISHTFIRFNMSTSVMSFYIYSKTGTLIYNTIDKTYSPSTCFGSNFTQFTLGRNLGTDACYVTIHLAGWYDGIVLSPTQMSDIVLRNL